MSGASDRSRLYRQGTALRSSIIPHDLRRLAGIAQPRVVDGLLRAAVPPAAGALPLLRDAPSLVLGPESHELGRQARRRLAEAA